MQHRALSNTAIIEYAQYKLSVTRTKVVAMATPKTQKLHFKMKFREKFVVIRAHSLGGPAEPGRL